MPLKRTPPKNLPAKDSSSETVGTALTGETTTKDIQTVMDPSLGSLSKPNVTKQKHDSTPDLRTLSKLQDEELSNVTLRFKRKYYEDNNSSNMEAMMAQMKSMFASYSQEQANQFGELKSSISKIERQNEDISRCMEFLSTKYDDMLEKIKNMELDKKKDKQRIQELENKVEALDRKLKDPVIEIRNLPLQLSKDKKYDTKEELCQIMKNLGETVKVNITEKDIKDIYSKKTNKDTQKIVVTEFTSVIQKEKIVEAVRNFNKGKQNVDKLNSHHLGLQAPKCAVYMSEALTLKTQKLLFEARKVSRDNGYVNCCTNRGSVFIKKSENSKYIKINNEEDLVNLKNSD